MSALQTDVHMPDAVIIYLAHLVVGKILKL